VVTLTAFFTLLVRFSPEVHAREEENLRDALSARDAVATA
jgi:hypothetical protein